MVKTCKFFKKEPVKKVINANLNMNFQKDDSSSSSCNSGNDNEREITEKKT